jgi:glycine betaine/proline transport system permease protein
MTSAATETTRADAASTGLPRWSMPAIIVLGFATLVALRNLLPDWLNVIPPRWEIPFVDGLNAVFDVLRTWEIFGLFTFRDFTRWMAAGVQWPLDFMEGILIGGFPKLGLPALPWIMVVGLAGVLGTYLRSWKLGLLAAGCIAYLSLVGRWELSMITLAAVLVAAPIAAAIGLALGVAASRSRRFEAVLWPLLNVMQSLPHFSYLVPVAVFIGVGHRAGTIATILFAFPPMARLTLLGLRGISAEIREAGIMAGCTARQMLWRVDIPAARPALMVGVNQVIMQCLAMVVIASFIGARGLGHDLLFRLQSLRLGQALEIGVAIVLIAITLDRLSQAWAARQPEHARSGPFWHRHPYLSAAGAVILASSLLAWLVPPAHTLPRSMTFTMAPFWDAMVTWITINLHAPLQVFRDGLLIHVLIPLREAFQSVPWIAVVALVAAAGWRLGGIRLALTVAGFIAFIVFSGYWERALITAYMVSFSVLVCVAIGLPVGVWAAGSDRRTRIMEVVCDTFQTFPSFIYLIPVIMLFRVGDVAAIMAIVIYAMIPTVRYTMFGLRGVPKEILEAAITSGCTPWQMLWKVRMPMAMPSIMVGANQTIMFALFMVIIAAFIGTRDLGQEIFRALTFNDAGKGLVLGLCVAFIGLTADRLITAWAERRKRELGLV